MLLANLMTRYKWAGCPKDQLVRVGPAEAARWAGYAGQGGNARKLVAQALLRLTAPKLRSTVRVPRDGDREVTWGLLDHADLPNIKLSRVVAKLVRLGSVTRLHEPTYRSILERDELAARLWTYLEAEQLRTGRAWLYSLFAAVEAEPYPKRYMPALSDLLRLEPRRRRDLAERLRSAAKVIVEEDHRYTLTIVRSPRRGMWRLEAKRGQYKDATRLSEGPATAPTGTSSSARQDFERRTRAQIGGPPSCRTVVFTVEPSTVVSDNVSDQGINRELAARGIEPLAAPVLPADSESRQDPRTVDTSEADDDLELVRRHIEKVTRQHPPEWVLGDLHGHQAVDWIREADKLAETSAPQMDIQEFSTRILGTLRSLSPPASADHG
jgi:hypothetical protein